MKDAGDNPVQSAADSSITAQGEQTLSKTERRRIARKKKKEKQLAQKKAMKVKKPKLTKEERRIKYTQRFLDKRDNSKVRNVVCFSCRKTGHTAAQCPEAKQEQQQNICYKCGSTEHRLALCPKLRNKKYNLSDEVLPFAVCFICKQKGHLAGQCSKNENGVYPQGGACKNCGGKNHLSHDCPQRIKKTKADTNICPVADIDELDAKDFEQESGDTQPNTITSEQVGGDKLGEKILSKKRRNVVGF